jgi:hypothetical protein
MGEDECSDFKDPIGRTFLSGNCIFAEAGLRRELSRTKVSAIREAQLCGRGASLRNEIVREMAAKYWLRCRSTNLQAPNPKQYSNSNFE